MIFKSTQLIPLTIKEPSQLPCLAAFFRAGVRLFHKVPLEVPRSYLTPSPSLVLFHPFFLIARVSGSDAFMKQQTGGGSDSVSL